MTALSTAKWSDRLKDFEAQTQIKSQLCRPITDKFLPLKGKPLPSPLGFTVEQYQAAYKTLALAIELFSNGKDLTREQLMTCFSEINVSEISMRIMWEDLDKAKKTPKEDQANYTAISQLAKKKTQEICDLFESLKKYQ